MDERNRIWPIAVLFAIYLVLATVLPAVDDEFYYWCWSKDVQWSYFDHPPMSAVLMRLSTTLFGDTVFGFRFPACVSSAFVIYVISRLTPIKGFVWAVVLTPLFAIFAVVMTPDSPLIMCWAAYLWWLVEVHRRLTPTADERRKSEVHVQIYSNAQLAETAQLVPDQSRTTSAALEQVQQPGIPQHWWFIGGVILGCGVLSKYTMGLAVPAGFLSFLFARRRWQEWLPGYVAHGVCAFVVASPILIFNIGHDFEPLHFQWKHVAEKVPSSLRSLGDFVGVQILAFGTMPFFLFPWVCYHTRQLCRNPRLRVCVCLYALPLAFFVYKSTQSRLEANWALICFISVWPLASEWYQSVRASQTWRWLTAAAFLPPLLSVIAIYTHMICPISIVPVRADRIHRQIAQNAAAREVEKKIREQGELLPVYTDTYQLTSLLRFQSLDARQIFGLTRPSHFTRPPRRLTDVDRAYVVLETPLPSEFSEGYPPPRLIADIPVVYRGQADRPYRIWLYSKD